MKIGYQGTRGSYSHQAIQGIAKSTVGFSSFQEVYEAVENGDVDLGLLPVENSLAGMIYETIDLLNSGPLFIVKELTTKIEHNLVALEGGKIEKVLSHPKALAQCTKLFHAHPDWEAVTHYDTAGAAALVAEAKDPKLAAIASREAAIIYGLKVIETNVQDENENFTRFFLLSKKRVKGPKLSITFTLKHEPGSLADTLQAFKEAKINLTTIVSRPIQNRPFEYLFFVDLLGEWEDLPKLPTKTLKILGSYETISDRPDRR